MFKFDKRFDFNRDGKLNTFEKVARYEFMKEQGLFGGNKEEKSVHEENYDRYELESVGLDAEELSMMDEDERREEIEDAGLDPDDYDFD